MKTKEKKLYVVGGNKGYLFKKDEFDVVLKKNFSTLKNAIIKTVEVGSDCYQIDFDEQLMREEKENHIVMKYKSYQFGECVLVKKEVFNKLFEIKDNIPDVTVGLIRNNKFCPACSFATYDKCELYYFFEIGDDYRICGTVTEIKEK